jgi:hypothetical protein
VSWVVETPAAAFVAGLRGNMLKFAAAIVVTLVAIIDAPGRPPIRTPATSDFSAGAFATADLPPGGSQVF